MKIMGNIDNRRITVNSVSGGKTSAYMAVHYPADIDIFAIVRIEDERCKPKDKALVRFVEDKINKEFIATAEDDLTLYAVMDLEQMLGREIVWVSGVTYDEVCRSKGGWLPNKLHRYCTVEMKIRPIFRYLYLKGYTPVNLQIGFRANEGTRCMNMLGRREKDGVLYFKDTFKKHLSGRHKGNNKWELFPYSVPSFPLYDEGIYKDNVESFWVGKPVRFAKYNNCVGCFHRNPLFLKKMFIDHPRKMKWFQEQEKPGKGTWRSDVRYSDINKFKPQLSLLDGDFSPCDAGYCGI